MREAVIVSMVRTPVGRVGGALSSITAAPLLSGRLFAAPVLTPR